MTPPRFGHILAMSNAIGTFEHADHTEPRRGDGYCTDDVARLLVVIAREPWPTDAVLDAGRTCMAFLARAQGVSGTVRNRRTARGRWRGRRGVEDCWGRSIWAFGTAAHRHPDPTTRVRALSCFERGVTQRSPWLRSMAFAALGASEVLDALPGHRPALDVLGDTAEAIGRPGAEAAWPWPEPRLAYANAVVPDALLAAGTHLGRPDVVDDGLMLLRWLLDRETVEHRSGHEAGGGDEAGGAHLSPTPVGGAGPADRAPRFDQQPIEVAAMADACARAAEVTGDPTWRRGVEMAAAWFLGDNDVAAPMTDPETGGCYDGLHARGPNLNQGAESTIALISTLQHGDRLAQLAA